jgi:peptidyl-tRNA hydrolase, PTH1 family
MPDKGLRLVVGLGNPGKTYTGTRHNIGFAVLDRIAEDCSVRFSPKRSLAGIRYGRGFIQDVETILAKPQMFMNNSGPPTRRLANYYKISSENMLVVHDDIDLVFGRLKIKEKGGHGGHRGLKSIMEAFGGGDFTRLRIGIGRGAESSEAEKRVTDHVLGRFIEDERMILTQIVSTACDAVVTILCEGKTGGMNRFNNKHDIVQP